MIEIIPAILPVTFSELETKIALVKDTTEIVQVDFCDGKFVPSKTWPFNHENDSVYEAIISEERGFPFWESISFELDLMVQNAHKRFDELIKLGPSRIVFHLEAEDETFLAFLENLDLFYKENFEIGIAISVQTSLEKIIPFIPHIKFIQCMGIDHEGYQGEPFDEAIYTKLEKLKLEYPNTTLSVDGAVSFKNVKELVLSGAKRLIVGSAIYGSADPEEAIYELQELCDNI